MDLQQERDRGRRIAREGFRHLRQSKDVGTISKTEATPPLGYTAEGKGNNNRATTKKMKITIASRIFTAKLYDNPTATRLQAMLALTLDMTELNGNEKYFHFSTNLPTDASNPGTIKAGDLMLWGANSLVLF